MSYELPSQSDDGRPSLDTILGPRRGSDAAKRASMESARSDVADQVRTWVARA